VKIVAQEASRGARIRGEAIDARCPAQRSDERAAVAASLGAPVGPLTFLQRNVCPRQVPGALVRPPPPQYPAAFLLQPAHQERPLNVPDDVGVRVEPDDPDG
jgi:hypothetical protein